MKRKSLFLPIEEQEVIMDQKLENNDQNPYNSFQVDLLNLNLHLTETEVAPETERMVHQKALAQMRALVSHS